ncbi:hypothetical protein IP91_00199 [Pseudoduganella lurida]|uniref:Uncharacterized protein n=1 Tax=Pseudoduganella lurida TaxID=1036180 RepID=A0A562RJN0_9BURK|nr:hypothetical protein [Pseudoduganella lurida]TWI69133.1 hypothetical protein IP91_00199 [Pseudoduganella lurida]
MSRAAASAKIFAICVVVVGAILVFAPDVVLAMFGMPTTNETWIRLVGALAFNIGILASVAARHDDRHFFAIPVYSRTGFLAAVSTFDVLGLASLVIILFGMIDLAGGIRTSSPLKADARGAARLPAQRVLGSAAQA